MLLFQDQQKPRELETGISNVFSHCNIGSENVCKFLSLLLINVSTLLFASFPLFLLGHVRLLAASFPVFFWRLDGKRIIGDSNPTPKASTFKMPLFILSCTNVNLTFCSFQLSAGYARKFFSLCSFVFQDLQVMFL